MKFSIQITLVFLITILLMSCSNHSTTEVERGMYYWKNNNWNLSIGELSSLGGLKVKKMYVKFFEVETDKVFGSIPTAKTSLYISEKISEYILEEDTTLPKSLQHIEIVPTVYIQNKVFYDATESNMDSLADNLLFLIDKYYEDKIHSRRSGYEEIQIDCDWTAKTKSTYFYLLQKLKNLSKKEISCTLRLYPYKYPELMGVPPVERATLMCYNLINPIENEQENSIQNNKELEKYLSGAEKYPIHLDVALPIYSWLQIYQNNRFVRTLNYGDIDIEAVATKEDDFWYTMNTNYEFDNLYLRIGDKIKVEGFTPEETHKSIDLLQKYIHFDDSTTVTLFHLDENNMKQYNNETYTSFYTGFSQ